MKDNSPVAAWYAEASAFEPTEDDFDVAIAADLPPELDDDAATASEDPEFNASYQEWLDRLFSQEDLTVLLAIEQSCDNGVLMPWDYRGARVQTAPLEVVRRMNTFYDDCPRHVAVYITHYVYWTVRSERTRRRGNPRWTPMLPLPPTPDWQKDPPAFRPMADWPKHWP